MTIGQAFGNVTSVSSEADYIESLLMRMRQMLTPSNHGPRSSTVEVLEAGRRLRVLAPVGR